MIKKIINLIILRPLNDNDYNLKFSFLKNPGKSEKGQQYFKKGVLLWI